jgi:SLT domain-containing protein
MMGIPMMAEGGIVTGPTLAMVGEGGGPEAVIPLDRLNSFIGGGNINVTGRIQGQDILLSQERASRTRSRYRGF